MVCLQHNLLKSNTCSSPMIPEQVTNYNMIPHSWHRQITTSSGRPLHRAMKIFSQIVFWYKPDIHGNPKFKDDILQTSYKHFVNIFCCSSKTISRDFDKLEELGLIKREWRTITRFGRLTPNVLFIRLTANFNSDGSILFNFVKNEKNLQQGKNEYICPEIYSGDIAKIPPSLASNKEAISSKDKDNLSLSKLSLLQGMKYKKNFSSSNIIVHIPRHNCSSYISKENKKENIKNRSDLRASTRSNSHIFLSEIKEQEKTIVDQASKQSDNRDVIVKPHNAKKEEKIIFSVISNKTSDFFKKLKETMKVRDWEEGRGLLELCDISQETVEKLNKNSGREFGQNFIRQLTQMLGQKYPEYRFYREEHFISYMSKALANELRQAPVANNLDFRFKALPMTREEEYVRKVNKYLEEIEGSTSQGKDMLWKKKIVGHFEPRLAYELLKGTIVNLRIAEGEDKNKEEDKGEVEVEEVPFVLEIKQIRQLETSLGESEEMIPDWIKGILLKIGREVYGDRVGGIEVEKLFDKKSPEMSRMHGMPSMPGINDKIQVSNERELEIEELKRDNLDDSKDDLCWSKVQKELKLLYGNATYKTWFKELDILKEEDKEKIEEKEKTLKIKSPTSFIRDWVKTNYGRQIEEIMKGYYTQLKYLEFV